MHLRPAPGQYFFVHKLQNYSRYALVYLSDMYQLQEKDPYPETFHWTKPDIIKQHKISISLLLRK